MTDAVARIAPATGQVMSYIDLRGLLSPVERAAVAAGKLWPKVFEVKIAG